MFVTSHKQVAACSLLPEHSSEHIEPGDGYIELGDGYVQPGARYVQPGAGYVELRFA